jgi:hypothetical protein
MTTGVSIIPASDTASVISANPPPEVETRERAPAYDAPMAMFSAAISSSACSNTRPREGPSLANTAKTLVPGVIG